MLVTALSCGKFGPGDLSRTIALEVIAPDSLEEYDSITPHARLLDGRGDSVAATIVWSLPDSADTVALTLLDTTTGRITVNHAGLTGRLLASAGTFVSNPVSIRTLAAADTLFPTGPTHDTTRIAGVTALDSLSGPLLLELADTVTAGTGGNPIVPLAGRPIVYTLAHPPTAGPVTLVTTDTARTLAATATGVTSAAGIAFVKVRMLLPDTVPDSVVVIASARRRAVGTTVPGTPATFVVRFQGIAVADTLFAAGPIEDTIHLSASLDSLSDSLTVEVGDTVLATNSVTPLAGRPVVFAITSPTTAGPVTLVTSDTAHALVTADTVTTDARGLAAVKVRLIAGARPDVVVVMASAKRGVSANLPGSPVTFRVRLLP